MALQKDAEVVTEVGVVPEEKGVVPEKRGDVVPEEKGVVPEKRGVVPEEKGVPEKGGAGEAATTGKMTPKGFFKGFLDAFFDTTTAFGSGLFGLLGDLGKSVDKVWEAAFGLVKTVTGVFFSFIPEKKPEPKPAASSTSGEKQESDQKQQASQANQANKNDKALQKSAADPDKDGNAGDDDHEHGGAGTPYSPPPTPSTRRVGSSRVPGG